MDEDEVTELGVNSPPSIRFDSMANKGDVPRSSRVSKQVMNLFQANKFQNLRKANEIKKDFYPDTAKAKAAVDDESSNIEVVLLQRKFDNDLAKKNDGTNRGTVNMNRLRETFLNIQSKRYWCQQSMI